MKDVFEKIKGVFEKIHTMKGGVAKLPTWTFYLLAGLMIAPGIFLLSEAETPSTGWIIFFCIIGAIVPFIFLAVKFKWFKKTATWKWSKIWNNGGMIATIVLFVTAAWFLWKKSGQTLQAATEPYADIRANREQRFAEREALFTSDPVPHNFKLGEWATYHKDSLYRYKRGLNVGLFYESKTPVTVTYTKVDKDKGDNEAGAEWYFTVNKTSDMIWSAKKNE